jgi:hypothetical protein
MANSNLFKGWSNLGIISFLFVVFIIVATGLGFNVIGSFQFLLLNALDFLRNLISPSQLSDEHNNSNPQLSEESKFNENDEPIYIKDNYKKVDKFVTIKPFDSPDLVLEVPASDYNLEKNQQNNGQNNGQKYVTNKKPSKAKRSLEQAIEEPPNTLIYKSEPDNSDHWCLIGQENGQNKCALVKDANKCMTGQAYLSEMECMKTKHYEMIPSPYHEVTRKISKNMPQNSDETKELENDSVFSFFSGLW